MTPGHIEALAWNCDEWPEELATLVEDMCERADQIGDGMSTEQLVAYAVLVERERCARIAEREWNGAPLYFEGPDISAAIRAGR